MRTERWGSANPLWRGDSASDQAGRDRARRRYPVVQPCDVCGVVNTGRGHAGNVRHHRDSNRLNNEPDNIQWLCGSHHMEAHRSSDGRIGGGPRPRVAAMKREEAIARGRRVRELRASGMTKRQVAAVVGIHVNSVDRYARKYPEVGA